MTTGLYPLSEKVEVCPFEGFGKKEMYEAV
jgi:hypothetical protein